MRVALAQFNPTVGDITGNTEQILLCLARAEAQGADLLVTPELAVFGYPAKDLLLRLELVQRNVAAVERIAARCEGIAAVVGFAQPDPGETGRSLFNAVAVCQKGKVQATYAKMLLPTYDVFDECRYFNAGQSASVFDLDVGGGKVCLGLTVCEDLWNDEQFEGRRFYGEDPIERTVQAGAEVLINCSASPYRAGIHERREALFVRQVREHGLPLVYVNQIGGNDDLLFDGGSLVLDRDGVLIARARAFAEDLMIVDVPAVGKCAATGDSAVQPYPAPLESVRAALAMGIRDYMRKCGFGQAILGLSGGIDSALTAALAVEAIGADNVFGVAMPSRYSSDHSLEDARALAKNLGIELSVIPIEPVHRAFEEVLRESFAGREPDVTEENIQSRIRGNLLMALSNKFGRMLLTTGNKSELAVGYCTLYGDMCGGLAVLSDVPKTMVYALARLMNQTADRPLIPERSISKAPSAELRPDQTDLDTLPPYSTLDAVLEHYIEQEMCIAEIAALGFDRSLVERIADAVDKSEYKRKQAAVGLKVTSRAFGTGRRMPIAARFR